MNFSYALGLIAALTVSTAGAVDQVPVTKQRSSIFEDMLHPFRGSRRNAPTAKVANPGKVSVELKLDPQPLKLSGTNRLRVTVALANRTKKLAQFEFPTTQRIEVLVRTTAGKLVEQWSQDQAFVNEPSMVTVNPGERAEYTVEVATRDLVAGQTYLVEGFFPQHVELKAQATVIPEK